MLGLPEILINFTSQASTAINRSARGIVTLILNDENAEDVTYKLIEDSSDVPTDIESSNIDLINKALMGNPLRIHAYLIPPASHEETVTREVEVTVDSDVVVTRTVDSDVVVTDPNTGDTDIQTIPVTYTDTEIQSVTYTDTVTETATVAATITQADALKACANVKFNYIAHPTGDSTNQQTLATWVISQRNNRHKVCKAVVANYAADDYGVVNFTTGGIKIKNPDGTYTTYTAAQYTARIAGILAGLSLDRSATYYTLTEIDSVDDYDDIDSHINGGELCLFDEKDGGGVKISRGINSLTSFTANVGEDFRFIKIIEALDLIRDDISTTFKENYVGKIVNSYDNKMLLVSSINSYLKSLEGNVLNPGGNNSVEIDINKNAEYIKSRGGNPTTMSEQAIREYPTGTNVFLAGTITPVNAFEDLTINFVLA